jgi:hypothetical protein
VHFTGGNCPRNFFKGPTAPPTIFLHTQRFWTSHAALRPLQSNRFIQKVHVAGGGVSLCSHQKSVFLHLNRQFTFWRCRQTVVRSPTRLAGSYHCSRHLSHSAIFLTRPYFSLRHISHLRIISALRHFGADRGCLRLLVSDLVVIFGRHFRRWSLFPNWRYFPSSSRPFPNGAVGISYLKAMAAG